MKLEMKMHCQRCMREMKMRSDGWKRCGRCGNQKMGLTLRLATLATEAAVAEPIETKIATARRLPVTWRRDQ